MAPGCRMSLRELISPEDSGYHIFRLAGLGEIHLEYFSRADSDGPSPVWEASIYYPRGGAGPLCTILHVFADSREDLFQQLDRALFCSLEGT